MEIKLYNRENIESLNWPESREGEFARKYLTPLITDGTLRYFDNIDTEVQVITFGNHILPLSFTRGRPKVKNSYVCSPTSHYIDYGKVESDIELKDKPFLKSMTHLLLNTCNLLFNRLDFEKVVYVNNLLLSTNLYNEFDTEYLTAMKDFLIKSFPGYTIIFRSINDMYNTGLYNKLKTLGFHHVFSRQVYILDPAKGEYKKRDSYRKDLKVKKRTSFYWEDTEKISQDDIRRMRFLYDDLYIHKYSELNPKFNENFIEETLKNNCITYRVLKKGGEIFAVFGYIECNGVITAPVFGYDTALSPAEGLYRLTALRILEDAVAEGWIVHMSSGVSKFKMYRGAEASMEYNMVYYSHIGFLQSLPWRLMEKITDYLIIPVMKKFQL